MADNPLIRKLFHLFFLFRRPMTLGVRVLVENEKGEILLVRHTYVDGWYLPGGGVEKGETLQQAARKELLEETGFEFIGDMELIGAFKNRNASDRDHVVLFHSKQVRQVNSLTSTREIAEIGFFELGSLPAGVTTSTLNRIEEFYRDKPVGEFW